MATKAYLYVRLAGRRDWATLVERRSYVLGRGHGADIIIPHCSVSRRHCEVVFYPESELHVTDLASANGSWVDGKPIRHAVITSGRTFRVGDVEILFLSRWPAEKRSGAGFLTPSTVVPAVREAPICTTETTDTTETHCDEAPPEVMNLLKEHLIGGSALDPVRKFVLRAARVDCPVLVQGETGTGKELVVQWIHRLSRRGQGPLVEVNCGALPPTLLEAELFGYERGAFTGAVSRRRGVFERASGGSLFLDELGELELPAQAKLLRVLETGRVQRLGGEHAVKVDVRLLAATNRRLAAAVASGQFRADLFFRLNVLHIVLPPLRRRKQDIPLLVEHFVRVLRRRLGRPHLAFTDKAIDKLRRHSWPGNIRELLHCLERAAVQSSSDLISADDIVFHSLPAGLQPRGNEYWEPAHVTRSRLELALERTAGNKAAAARLLGINRGQLYRLLRRYRLT